MLSLPADPGCDWKVSKGARLLVADAQVAMERATVLHFVKIDMYPFKFLTRSPTNQINQTAEPV